MGLPEMLILGKYFLENMISLSEGQFPRKLYLYTVAFRGEDGIHLYNWYGSIHVSKPSFHVSFLLLYQTPNINMC